jgi:two-component system chemotaxis sensor kinase CheA
VAMNDDMDKYKDAFLSEARFHVKDMNSILIQWEKNPEDRKHLQSIFRMAHTLKSISAAMGYEKIAELCHAIEDLLESVRSEKKQLKDCVDLFFSSFDFLGETINAVAADKPELDPSSLITNISQTIANKKPSRRQVLDHADDSLQSITTIEVKVERLDKLLNLTKELLVNKMRIESLSENIQSSELTTHVDIMNRIVSELQYHVMQIRLVPIGFVFDRFTRMVRDLAKSQHKEVELKTIGREIELDRSLIDNISEAIAHLIRNAIDHGLPSTSARKAADKSPIGRITLRAKREKETIVIEVGDNGSGLDVAAIKKKAVQTNVLPISASREEVIDSIFNGVSTSRGVTKISGRGLGLSIVRQKIEAINGSVQVKTKEGEGTVFIVRIPLTLAVILVLLVRQGDHTYAIPLNSIERLITVPADQIKGLLNDKAIVYNEASIPLLNLATLFALPSYRPSVRMSILVLRKEGALLGLIVDALLSTEEIITQPLNSVIKASKFFSGTALLGSGEMILILDVEQFFIMSFGSPQEETANASISE